MAKLIQTHLKLNRQRFRLYWKTSEAMLEASQAILDRDSNYIGEVSRCIGTTWVASQAAPHIPLKLYMHTLWLFTGLPVNPSNLLILQPANTFGPLEAKLNIASSRLTLNPRLASSRLELNWPRCFKPLEAKSTYSFKPLQAKAAYGFKPLESKSEYSFKPLEAKRPYSFKQLEAKPKYSFTPLEAKKHIASSRLKLNQSKTN